MNKRETKRVTKYEPDKTFQLIRHLSGQANTLTIPKIYVQLTGSLNAALFLNQCVFWNDKTKRRDGYFYKSQKEWELETTLTRHKLNTARARCKELGYVDVENKRANGAPTLHFRVHPEKLLSDIYELLRQNDGANHDLPESNKSDLAESSKSDLLESDKSELPQTGKSLTEEYTEEYAEEAATTELINTYQELTGNVIDKKDIAVFRSMTKEKITEDELKKAISELNKKIKKGQELPCNPKTIFSFAREIKNRSNLKNRNQKSKPKTFGEQSQEW